MMRDAEEESSGGGLGCGPEPDTRRGGARAARFADCLRQSQSQLFAYLHSIVRDLNDVDDLFQQVTVILWRKFDDFEEGRSFAAWACGIARLEARNFLRVRSRSKLYFSDDLNLLLIDAAAQTTHDETEARRAALAGCMEKLRARDRELVEKCFAESAAVEKVAAQSGRSAQSLYNSLRRIRRALFECVQRSVSQQMRGELPGVTE